MTSDSDQSLAYTSSIVPALGAFQIVHICAVVGVTWLVYDWILLIPDEIQHFWLGGWTFAKLLYFFNRVIAFVNAVTLTITFFDPISANFCLATIWYQLTGNSLQVLGLWAILMMRTHALYQSRVIKISMVILFLLAATAMITIAIETGLGTPSSNQPFPGVFYCSASASYHRRMGIGIAWAWWIPALIVESFLFVLALIQLVWNIQFMKKRALLFVRPRLYVEILLRDSIWYFAAILSVDLAALLIWQHPTGHVIGGAQWTNALFVPFVAFVSSRMSYDILELMRRKTQGHLDTATTDLISYSGLGQMLFASPATADISTEMYRENPRTGHSVL